MKKFIFCLASFVVISALIMSCESSSLQDQEENDVVLSTRGKPDPVAKVDVCHYDKELDEYQHINISGNAVRKHINNHGDNVVDLADADADNDGIADCADCFPEDDTSGEKNTWYLDADGDGFGDPDTSIKTCRTLDEANAYFAEMEDEEDQKVFVDNDSDCNDEDSSINPAAPEVCDNGIDEDCDGNVDEDCV